MTAYRYVPADEFTPESRINWIPLGRVTKWIREGEERLEDKFTLFLEGDLKLCIYFLSHAMFRVRFNPDPKAPYGKNLSPATEMGSIEASDIKVEEQGGFLRIGTCIKRIQQDN